MIAVDFLKTYAIKIALVLIVFVAGAALGYKLGYDSAWSTQQATINKMAKAENDRRDSDNSRLNNAEQAAPKLTQQAEAKTKPPRTHWHSRLRLKFRTRRRPLTRQLLLSSFSALASARKKHRYSLRMRRLLPLSCAQAARVAIPTCLRPSMMQGCSRSKNLKSRQSKWSRRFLLKPQNFSV